MAFVNFQRLFELNKDKAETMGQKVAGKAEPALNAAAHATGYLAGGGGMGDAESKVREAKQKAEGLGTMGGAAAALGGQANALDAALAGRSQAMSRVQSRAQNLDKMLADANKAYQARQHAARVNADFARESARMDATAAEREEAEQRRRDDDAAGLRQFAYERGRDMNMRRRDEQRKRERSFFSFFGR